MLLGQLAPPEKPELPARPELLVKLELLGQPGPLVQLELLVKPELLA